MHQQGATCAVSRPSPGVLSASPAIITSSAQHEEESPPAIPGKAKGATFRRGVLGVAFSQPKPPAHDQIGEGTDDPPVPPEPVLESGSVVTVRVSVLNNPGSAVGANTEVQATLPYPGSENVGNSPGSIRRNSS